MNILFEHNNHLIIPHGTLWVADAYLSYLHDDIRNAVIDVVESSGERVYGADFKLVVTKENGNESDVLGLITDRLNELLAEYPGYTIVQRVCFTEPYTLSTNKEGIVGAFIGNIAKNPALSNEKRKEEVQ